MSKVWLITGSSRGFGRELVKAALDKGDRVVATARRPEMLDDLVRLYGDQIRTYALDVTDAVAAKNAVSFTVEEFGTLDVVVNNAGYADSAPIEEMSDGMFRAQIEANLFGVVNVTKAALPILRKKRSGHMIQFSSIGGRVGGTPGMGAYQTAKYAVEGFSEVLNNEVSPLGIKVIIVEPGGFRTDWNGSSMRKLSVSADYEDTVGATNRFRDSFEGNQPGDPVRGAKIVVDLVRMEEPPLRMLLGSDAVEMAATSSKARTEEAEKWAELSRSADYPKS
ncbi:MULTISPECIES: oxidoreductase [Paenibacillus]|uniref:oxidoreductase n=1 Tax=Paenibacillus TaxID=44249 RepID=UPI00073E7A34|nr:MULTISPECIES: oxidoreductase [Paenibacillus]MDU4697809.1 oxidoreductase [Paenibacillus sp.]